MTAPDVDEAVRLFEESTVQAAQASSALGIDLGEQNPQLQEEGRRAETYIKQRVGIGVQVKRIVLTKELVSDASLHCLSALPFSCFVAPLLQENHHISKTAIDRAIRNLVQVHDFTELHQRTTLMRIK